MRMRLEAALLLLTAAGVAGRVRFRPNPDAPDRIEVKRGKRNVCVPDPDPGYTTSHVIANQVETCWGKWGDWDACPTGTFAKAVAGRWETDLGSGVIKDDTALNAIKLYCGGIGEMPVDALSPGRTITSREGPFGEKNSDTFWCPGDGFITGFTARSEVSQGWDDDTAMNSVKVSCSSGGSGGPEPKGVGGTTWGDWTGWRHCPPGTLVAALRTQVEGNQGAADDTAMNNVRMDCIKPSIDCTPSDAFREVHRCNNIKPSGPIGCSYQQTVGMQMMVSSSKGGETSKSFSKTLGVEVGVEIEGIVSGKISSTNEWTTTTGYSWSTTKESWSSQSTTRCVDAGEISAGYTGVIMQVHANCGSPFRVWAPSFKVMMVENAKLAAAEASLEPDAFRQFLLAQPESFSV